MRFTPLLAGTLALLVLAAPVSAEPKGNQGQGQGRGATLTAESAEECEALANHGQYVRCMGQLRRAGLLTETEGGHGRSEAAQSCIGKPTQADCESKQAED